MSNPQPRPHQVQALTDLVAAFAIHDRTQLIMACGTGKTLVGRWHTEASDASNVLVLVPSLALLAQTLREWRRDHTWGFEALVVCSDPTTSSGAAERGDDDLGQADWSTVRAQVTTDPRAAARFMRSARPERPQVVFSTYHSAPVVAAAQAQSGHVFDLAICDEAHRLAGSPREEFLTALDPRAIVARKRLFMTATPRNAGADGYSMDDPKVFGPVAHTVTFGDAISAGLLCDYQVLVLGTAAGDADDDPLTLGPAAVVDAIDQHGATRVLTFHGRVSKATAFAQLMDGHTTRSGKVIAARHVDGKMPTDQRGRALTWLGDQQSDQVRVISNARVLSEGVDVPAVDAVCFADRRSSVVDIIQAVGRVLRPAPGKTLGRIIVPIALPSEDSDDDTELLISRFSLLWAVLRALRSHDQRFAAELDKAVRGRVRHGAWGYRPERLQFILPDGFDEELLHLRVVDECGDAWERYFAATREWAFENPGRRLPRMTRRDGVGIGEWAVSQRVAHARGVLPADRARRLEQIPDWYWDRGDAAWDDTYEILKAHVAAQGTIAENPTGESAFAGLRASKPFRERLGQWLATQRQAHRAGLLDPARVEQLEALSGWTWHPVPAEDLAMVDALAQFVEFEKHAQVPDRHVEDGLELGRWCWKVRRAKVCGALPPALEDEIWAATPSQWRVGARTRWQWETAETKWRIAYTALLQFTEREGHAYPRGHHREELADTTVRLAQWASLQRHAHRKGELDERKVKALAGLPGWTWEGDVGGTVPAEEPIALPAHLSHGAAGAYVRGCRCQECLEYRRATDRKHLQRKRDERDAVGISGAKARRHLAALQEQLTEALIAQGAERRRGANIGQPLIAQTSGVPVGVLRRLATDPDAKVLPEHEMRLLATTVQACLSNATTAGRSRGRIGQSGQQRVDGRATREILDDLAGRGFTLGWVGRELGYASQMQVTGDTITKRVADQIADLHRRAAGLRMPELHRTQRRPSLDQLRREMAAAS